MKELSCLVVPDGTYSECLKMLNFALECALRLPTLTFIFRFHPVFDFIGFCKINPKFANLPSNIQISKNELKNDLKLAGWCLYRGSGVVIQGVIAGLRPLYIYDEGLLNLDPLYGLNSWKKYVKNAEEFSGIIKIDLELDREKLIMENMIAREYCIEYQEPIHMENFINAIIRE